MDELHKFMETALPIMISILEIIGIAVVFWSGIHGFWQYVQNTFLKKQFDLQSNLAKGLAMGLEFEMAAEILKTILIQNMEEIYILGGIIVLRIALSLLIHFENRAHKKDEEPSKEDELPSKEEEKQAKEA